MIGGISVWQLLILLLIVVLVFGTKRLRNVGGDLGSAIKGFRKGMEEEPGDETTEKLVADAEPAVKSEASDSEGSTSRTSGSNV